MAGGEEEEETSRGSQGWEGVGRGALLRDLKRGEERKEKGIKL